MNKLVSSETMHEVMEWAYVKAVNGIGLGSATEMAEDYLAQSGTLEDKINSLIRWQNTKAGSAGFVAGIGGIATLPATLPANIASTLYIQIRMICAIAHMTGCDIRHDKVKTLVYLCLLGNGMGEALKDVGVTATTKLAENFIKKSISGTMLTKINKAVGFRLVTKAGSTGLINLTKLVPVLGGAVSGGFDALTTNIVGNKAREVFLSIDYQQLIENIPPASGNIYEHR